MDLFSLLPLGELWVAAARMRQVDRLQHTLSEAFALLESLGNPVLWSVPLHWAGVHAGILANSPEAVAPHGQALTAGRGAQRIRQGAGHRGPYLAAGAGQSRRHRRGDRGGAGVVAVRPDLGCHPAGQPGRPADARRTSLRGNAAVGARPQADRRDRRDTGRGTGGGGGRGMRPAAARRGRRPRGCPTANAKWPNCCCSACRTATSAASCSSRPRPSSITSRGSGGGSAPSRARRCCRCCARCWRRRPESPNAGRSPNRNSP